LNENYGSVAEKATYKIETRAGGAHYVYATAEDVITKAEPTACVDEQPIDMAVEEEGGEQETVLIATDEVESATEDIPDVVEVLPDLVESETSPKRSKRLKKPANVKSPIKPKIRRNTKTATVTHEVPTQSILMDEEEDDEQQQDDGLSCDDFPARDEENEEWPAAEVSNEFPNDLIKDGKLQLKGKPLLDIICK
jgi:hypothetical protein